MKKPQIRILTQLVMEAVKENKIPSAELRDTEIEDYGQMMTTKKKGVFIPRKHHMHPVDHVRRVRNIMTQHKNLTMEQAVAEYVRQFRNKAEAKPKPRSKKVGKKASKKFARPEVVIPMGGDLPSKEQISQPINSNNHGQQEKTCQEDSIKEQTETQAGDEEKTSD